MTELLYSPKIKRRSPGSQSFIVYLRQSSDKQVQQNCWKSCSSAITGWILAEVGHRAEVGGCSAVCCGGSGR